MSSSRLLVIAVFFVLMKSKYEKNNTEIFKEEKTMFVKASVKHQNS